MAALMIQQAGAADDGLIVHSDQALYRFSAMTDSSQYLKLLMTFTVIVIGILGTWSLTVKMLACHRHCRQTLHVLVQSFLQWLRPINDWKDLTDQECENLHTEADDFRITLNGWESSHVLHSDPNCQHIRGKIEGQSAIWASATVKKFSRCYQCKC